MMTRTIMRIMGATLLAEVPFAMLKPHEEQAQRNHGGQSLEKLASRGGLSASEALDIIEGRRWASTQPGIDTEQQLISKVREWRAAEARIERSNAQADQVCAGLERISKMPAMSMADQAILAQARRIVLLAALQSAQPAQSNVSR